MNFSESMSELLMLGASIVLLLLLGALSQWIRARARGAKVRSELHVVFNDKSVGPWRTPPELIAAEVERQRRRVERIGGGLPCRTVDPVEEDLVLEQPGIDAELVIDNVSISGHVTLDGQLEPTHVSVNSPGHHSTHYPPAEPAPVHHDPAPAHDSAPSHSTHWDSSSSSGGDFGGGHGGHDGGSSGHF